MKNRSVVAKKLKLLNSSHLQPAKIVIGLSTLYCGDAYDVLPLLAPSSIESGIIDPPYGIDFMGKDWDSDVPRSGLWKLVGNALKPGAHLLSFSSARTYHKVATEIENAGFDIRDQIMWIYGSGMPKSQNIAKGIEARKATGSASPTGQRKAAMGESYCLTAGAGKPGYANGGNFFGEHAHHNGERTPELAINDNEATNWDGWGTNLKPAHEPICMARKPFKGSCTVNVMVNGVGALNIDACRIPGDNPSAKRRKGSTAHLSDRPAAETEAQGRLVSRQSPEAYRAVRKGEALGRWPANVMHDGSPEVLAHFPDVRTGKGTKNARQPNAVYSGDFSGGADPANLNPNGGDSGSAARFFYCGKATKSDREEGLDEFAKHESFFFQTGGGKSGVPAKGVHVNAPRANTHETVKPTALMANLCRLVTPKGGVVLDCFMGSGSTGKAALREGFRFIGIERDPEYFKLACARIAHAQGIAFADIDHDWIEIDAAIEAKHAKEAAKVAAFVARKAARTLAKAA